MAQEKQRSHLNIGILLFIAIAFAFSFYAFQPKQRRVYVDMVADLFHYGHQEFLKKAKEEGNYLIVGIHSDETVSNYKRVPVMTMEERIQAVKSCPYVDEVVIDAPLHITQEMLNALQIDLVVHGNDISPEDIKNFYEVPISLGKFKTVEYTEGVSTTDILKRIQARDDLID
ncbi:MAG: adenylyltransferase/cytidyltransferase family protein [Chlamydiia bacterium]|nr:adenylyltransferase/cytidyltransferase family protein [Chlamydiia bacterium]